MPKTIVQKLAPSHLLRSRLTPRRRLAPYTKPANNSIVKDEIVLEVAAGDNGSGIDHVEFKAKYDGQWHTLNRDTLAPYQFTWNATGVADQAGIILGGVVIDNYDREGQITQITVMKDGTPPDLGPVSALKPSARDNAVRNQQ